MVEAWVTPADKNLKPPVRVVTPFAKLQVSAAARAASAEKAV